MNRFCPIFALAGLLAAAAAQAQPLPSSCPARPTPGVGPDFSGRTLNGVNFSRQDLTNANFRGAKLQGAMFQHAKLEGADFTGATFLAGTLPSDFSFANLTNACFEQVTFNGPTYFSYATLNCTDFSNTDLSANVAFGAAPRFNTSGCRPAFRNTVMNCEFFPQWSQLDLGNANIAACKSLIRPGQNFAGAMMRQVIFDGLDLSNTVWTGADLTAASFQNATLDGAKGLGVSNGVTTQLSRAKFSNASLKNVDFSGGMLAGTYFTYANLEAANLARAYLTNNPPETTRPADFTGALLKNVNLSQAQLTAAIFSNANLYGGNGPAWKPPATCVTDLSKCTVPTGATCGCTTLSGATLSRANFGSAFIYGVDFSQSATTLNGTDFTGAVLASSNFAGATFTVDPTQGGAPVLLGGTYLQGTNLANANLAGSTLAGAFVDFGSPNNRETGNIAYLQLGAEHTKFRGWGTPAQPVCVQVNYTSFSALPANSPSVTCPDGNSYAGGCGATAPAAAAWNNGIHLVSGPVPGTYQFPSTFDTAGPPTAACTIRTVDRNW